MRLETDHADGRALGPRSRRRIGHHLTVAEVHAIKIAERHSRAAIGGRQLLPAVDNAQGL